MFKILKNSINLFGKKYKEGGLFQFLVNLFSPLYLAIIIVVLNFFFDVFLNLSVNFKNTYYTFVSANVNFTEHVIAILIIAFAAIGCYFVYSYINEAYINVRKMLLESLEKISTARNEFHNKKQEPQPNIDLSDEEFLLELGRVETNVQKKLSKWNNKRYLFNGVYALAIVLPVYLLLIVLISNSISNKNLIFKLQTTILLPYIGQDEVNKLNSSWALMRNETDYIKINTQIEEAKKKYLP
ncbi:MAG: hypothetical protein NTZ69_17545 [Bacteroidia bacterium]|nr:hypothetical protein [Bacteroidia bacterium]